MMPLDAVIYLGEGHTPMVEANTIFYKRKPALDSTLKMTARTPVLHLKIGAWPAP